MSSEPSTGAFHASGYERAARVLYGAAGGIWVMNVLRFAEDGHSWAAIGALLFASVLIFAGVRK